MRCKVLRSGSSGNCTLIETEKAKILIDAGFSQRRILEILDEARLTPSMVSGLLATHCHADHLNYSTLQVCRKNNIPLWVNQNNIEILKTLYKKSVIENCDLRTFGSDPFTINDVTVHPFELSHDAAGKTSGFKISNGGSLRNTITYAADLGIFPDSLIPYFSNSSVIIIEANHDTEMLWNNPLRPYVHKKRVTGDYGHLSNVQSAEAIIKILKQASIHPDHIVLCHLSEDHNTPELAQTTIKEILQKEGFSSLNIQVANRQQSTSFIEVCG